MQGPLCAHWRRSAGYETRLKAAVRSARVPGPCWLDMNGEIGWRTACRL